MVRSTLAALVIAAASGASASSITDLNTWTQIVDPFDPNLSGVINNATQATLSSTGAVPSGTDIGYASVNGPDVAGSTAGFYFDPTSSFSVAIDYDISGMASLGAGGIGLGVGEDTAGADSAGVGVGFANGALFAASGAGRIDNADVVINPPVINFVGSSGRLFVDYNAGAITGGHSATPGAAAPSSSYPVPIDPSADWDGENLFVSFFLRSQAVNPFPGFASGTVDAVFSNFEVLSGTPIAVPEPSSACLVLALACVGGLSRRR
ncbi:MAG: hypothetical protein AAFV43_08810 [Planctomycetota bacterium]